MMPVDRIIIHASIRGANTEFAIVLFHNFKLAWVHLDCIDSLPMLIGLVACISCKIWQVLELGLLNIVLESYIFCKLVNLPIISINHFRVVQDLIWLRFQLLCLLSFKLILLLLFFLEPFLHLHVLNIPEEGFLPPFNLDPLEVNLRYGVFMQRLFF
jgi:hypothetical protein